LVRDLRFGGSVVPTPNGGEGMMCAPYGNLVDAPAARTVNRNIHQLVDELESLGNGVWGAVAWQACADGPCYLRTVNCSHCDAFGLLAEHLSNLIKITLT